MRNKATNDFEKDFFKLMNNSVFGKTMENVRKHVDIKLADNWKNASYYIRKPTYKTLHPFSDTLVAIHMKKDKIKFNKPIYIGFSVLELSKHLMYETYYDKLQNKFNCNDKTIKAKGIKKSTIKNKIIFDDLHTCLKDNKNTNYTMQRFKSIDHEIFTIEFTKRGLSALDDKRYYLNNIESVPYGS